MRPHPVAPGRRPTTGDHPPLAILLADDEPVVLEEVGDALRELGHHVTTACDGAQVLAYFDSRHFDLVISDVRLPSVDGLEILRRLRADARRTDVVLISGYATISDAVEALKGEAVDYIAKPFEMQKLLHLVDGVAQRQRLLSQAAQARAEVASASTENTLVGHSAAIVRLRERLTAFAASEAPVLILGESGSGKELAARLSHQLSPRKAGPFVAINCAAFTDSLIESELFGHVRGAFTGAIRDRQGRLADANGGTLFLDEVGELSPVAQAKLLRVLEDGTFTPVGSNATLSTDIRLVCATHQDLRRAISEGRFREDLFFRIKVLDVQVPSLAQRSGDLPVLAEHFLRRYTPAGRQVPRISPGAWAALAHHRFPGNVRELEHALEYALVLSRGEDIGVEHLPDDIRGEAQSQVSPSPAGPLGLSIAVEFFEREYILRALALAGGRRAKAAQLLGISRKHLWHKMRKHAISETDLPS